MTLDKSKDKPSPRELFSGKSVYTKSSVSVAPTDRPKTYSERLLKIRFDLLKQYAKGVNVLDVGCATGQHIMHLSEFTSRRVGVDFSLPFLQEANESKNAIAGSEISFVCCDARNLPFASGTYDFAYSFSTLYLVPSLQEAIVEISRMLQPKGRCILDLANRYSVSAIVANVYHQESGWGKPHTESVSNLKKYVQAAGLRIVKHRAFQILPLWGANRPFWLMPLLLPFWTALLMKEIKGIMIDEWISRLPLLSHFAFRHIFLCEKL
jgi:ubiquinone/menaquinone biosynthesis C-methylase UbiE